MIEKQHIETFLKANGIKPTASDEEIRSVLISARWEHDEIDTALIVLKENIVSHETHIDTLHKVFNSDDRLDAAEISALLGIEVTLSARDVNMSVTDTRRRTERGRIIFSFVLSVCIAAGSVGYVAYRVHEPSIKKVADGIHIKSTEVTSSTAARRK